ncbi:MAG: hypothetical protein ACO3A4_11460 [Silvanigrellaceae bacterium]
MRNFGHLYFLFILIGCGATSAARKSAPCSAKSLNSSSGSGASPLNLVQFSAEEEKRLGLGYLDITTDVGTGPQGRRCTMSVAPIPGQADFVRVTTAAHCGWPAESDEFAKSKYSLHIYYNGGYFPAVAQMKGQNDWHVFAKKVSPYVGVLPVELTRKFVQASTDVNKTNCVNLSQNIRTTTDPSFDILCLSDGEERPLVAKIEVDSKYREILDRILEVVSNRKKSILDNLPPREKLIFSTDVRTPYERVPGFLQDLGFQMNPFFCAAPVAELPPGRSGLPMSQALCGVRDAMIAMFKADLPQLWPAVQVVVDKPFASNEEMRTFHRDNIACTFKSLDEIDPANSNFLRTNCDEDMIGWYIWKEWVRNGLTNLATLQVNDKSKVGFTPETFFSLFTNSVGSREAAESNDTSKARPRLFSISPVNGSFTLDNAMAFLLNPVQSDIWVSKKDSGSLFSIFGVIPVGVLSSYNGEPTSGGASILPLPVVNDGEESKTPLTGCSSG